RRLPLGEQHRPLGRDVRERDGVERQQRFLGQAAEVTLHPPLARRAVLEEFEAVGRVRISRLGCEVSFRNDGGASEGVTLAPWLRSQHAVLCPRTVRSVMRSLAPTQIVLATDFSDAAADALRTAALIGDAFGADLSVVFADDI